MIRHPDSNVQIRRAAVAGKFYPDSPEALREAVEKMLLQVGEQPAISKVKALLVPHAGYIYSGQTAARAFALWRAEREVIKRVVILGSAHRVRFDGLALPECGAFETPLGIVPVDEGARAVLGGLPQVRQSDQAHEEEHCLEVALPFLQVVLDDFSMVPLLAGEMSAPEMSGVIDQLWADEATRFVISSDLSHYQPDPDARRIDAQSVAKIMALVPDLDLEAACGALPINAFLMVASARGLSAHLLEMCNSGQVSGNRQRVVGYAAVAFSSR